VVPPHPTKPLWHGWRAESDGRTPWEAAQVTALDVICEIAQNFGDELVGGPAASIPRVALTKAIRMHDLAPGPRGALVRGRGECV
jgi:hypothetical protein